MTEEELNKLRYPIGRFSRPDAFTKETLESYISIISSLPAKLKKEVSTLNAQQLDMPYRPGGWTVRQVVHHLADSHLNSFTRFKLALTEDKPTIKPYEEALWAELPDGKAEDLGSSLLLLEGLHVRWVVLMRSLNEEGWKRSFIHPEQGRELALNTTAALYAWHCEHHLAHIVNLKVREGWK